MSWLESWNAKKLGGTTFESGIAIPHCEDTLLQRFSHRRGGSEKPIVPSEGSPVQAPTKIVYLILISNTVSTLI